MRQQHGTEDDSTLARCVRAIGSRAVVDRSRGGRRPAWYRVAAATAIAAALAGCAPQVPSFGNFGGPPRPQPPAAQPAAVAPGELIGAQHEVRWYPRSARFAPDESHLLVSLCHFRYSYYCRIARYWIADNRWEVVPEQRGISTAWPDYSADGRRIVFAQQRCKDTYQCSALDFALATMNRDGSGRRELDVTGVQMPSWSPDGQRLLYWRLNGVGRLSSGRTIGSFDVYEYRLEAGPRAATGEVRLTHDAYPGTYTAPQYYAGGQKVLYSAYASDRTGSYGFTMDLHVLRSRSADAPRRSEASWDGPRWSMLYAFHPARGWLYSDGSLRFRTADPGRAESLVLRDSKYYLGAADVSPSAQRVVVLTGTPRGTMDQGGAISYLKPPRPPAAHAVPVMALIDVATGTVYAITNWPADAEPVTALGGSTASPTLSR